MTLYNMYITKTRLYNFDPLKPHFYIVKLGFTGVYIIFLISAQNTDCWYSLKPPRRGGSNEYPQWKNIRVFLSENFHFLVVNFSVILNRHVFVMVKAFNPLLSCWARIYPAFANSLDSDQLASPTNLDLRCLSFTVWIYIHNLNQGFSLADN